MIVSHTVIVDLAMLWNRSGKTRLALHAPKLIMSWQIIVVTSTVLVHCVHTVLVHSVTSTVTVNT